jgi:hypothetical protein
MQYQMDDEERRFFLTLNKKHSFNSNNFPGVFYTNVDFMHLIKTPPHVWQFWIYDKFIHNAKKGTLIYVHEVYREFKILVEKGIFKVSYKSFLQEHYEFAIYRYFEKLIDLGILAKIDFKGEYYEVRVNQLPIFDDRWENVKLSSSITTHYNTDSLDNKTGIGNFVYEKVEREKLSFYWEEYKEKIDRIINEEKRRAEEMLMLQKDKIEQQKIAMLEKEKEEERQRWLEKERRRKKKEKEIRGFVEKICDSRTLTELVTNLYDVCKSSREIDKFSKINDLYNKIVNKIEFIDLDKLILIKIRDELITNFTQQLSDFDNKTKYNYNIYIKESEVVHKISKMANYGIRNIKNKNLLNLFRGIRRDISSGRKINYFQTLILEQIYNELMNHKSEVN